MNPEDVDTLRLLLAAVARRDGNALGQLYKLSSAKLFALSLRILGRRELAEEALQESFVSIWNNAGSYNESLAGPMTWMVTIVRNKCFDMLRRLPAGHEQAVDEFEQDLLNTLAGEEGADPAMLVEGGQQARALASCLSRLEKRQREALVLAWLQDLSHTEIAERVQAPVGTIKTWIRRAMEKLRTCLAGWEPQ